MLLVAACTDKQTDGNTVSGLNPADFRMEVDGKQTYFFEHHQLWWTHCFDNGTGQRGYYARCRLGLRLYSGLC